MAEHTNATPHLFVDDLLRASMDEPMMSVVTRTMRDVLDEAHVGARQMAEARLMCEHVVQRFETIAIESLKVSPPPPMAATNSFKALLMQYVEFLKKFAKDKTIFRLVHNRIVVRQNLRFHNDIDNLLKGLQLPEGNEVLEDWRPQWEKFRDEQAAAFETMSGQKNKLIENLDPTDTHAQTEALGLLLYEYNQVTAEYTKAELKVLYKAFTEVSRFSKSKTPTIVTWFLPPYQFEFNETAFAFGGFGNVHYGKHCGTDVAVKCVILKNEADRPKITAAFVKEANLWFKANNIPNVVRLFGANHIAEKPYFVSEYAANGTLKSYVFEEKNRHQIWKLLLDAANGIRALHQLNILHNDLKCDNIVVDFGGNAKITDFGLCCELPRPNSKALVPVMENVGAVPWKAPEILAETSPPSIASDVYAFGMCILEAVSNSNPWNGMMEVMIRRKVNSEELPPRPENVFEDDQWDLVKRMCAFDPAMRLSMDQVVEQLTKFENREGNKKLKRQNTAPVLSQPTDTHTADELYTSRSDSLKIEFDSPDPLLARRSPIVTPVESGFGMQRRSSLTLLVPIREHNADHDDESPPALQSNLHTMSEVAVSPTSSDELLDPQSISAPDEIRIQACTQTTSKGLTSPIPVIQMPPLTDDAPVDMTSQFAISETPETTQEAAVEEPTYDSNDENLQSPALVSGELPLHESELPFQEPAARPPCHSTVGSIDPLSGEPESEPEQEPTPSASLSVKSATILNFRYISLDESSKRIVQYQVKLKLTNNNTHTVWKRFSAFRNCWQGLRDRDGVQVASSLPFPSRFSLSGNLARSTVKRKNELNDFLTEVFKPSCALPLGVLMSDGTSYFKAGLESDVLL